ncbi:Bub2 protein, partial [Globisporangium splendens]
MEMPKACPPSDAHGESVINEHDAVIDTDYERWRELKRMVIVFGLPRIDANALQMSSHTKKKKKKKKVAASKQQESDGASIAEGDKDANVPEARTPKEHEADELLAAEDVHMEDACGDEDAQEQHEEENCSLRGRVWKVFLGVHAEIDRGKYAEMAERGASYCDDDIRNDTFRTFRGDPAFAQRVPEEKLVRLLNVFINELGSNSSSTGNSESKTTSPDHPDYIRYVQGMNILCAPLLYVMPEADAYYTFCNLIVKHCPHYMAPKLKGVESGCLLVDKCLQTGHGLDEDSESTLCTSTAVGFAHLGCFAEIDLQGSEKDRDKLPAAAATASAHSVVAVVGTSASRPRWKI